ncbi:MAG: hypothetical protein ABIL70_05255 [candidate division WOR-3 bacterium]
MKKTVIIFFIVMAFFLNECKQENTWRDSFQVNKANLRPTGINRYFIIQPGHKLIFANGNDTIIQTVLDETYIVDGVETRVIVDSEKVNDQLSEVTRDYFAIDTTTGDVYYFGEDVNIYENGQVVSHEGSWLSGVNGARFGLMMPGKIIVGDKYYNEIAPGVAMDRAEIISQDETVTTPLNVYEGCLHIEETTPLESGTAHKYYAPQIGLIKDEDFLLVKIVTNPEKNRNGVRPHIYRKY